LPRLSLRSLRDKAVSRPFGELQCVCRSPSILFTIFLYLASLAMPDYKDA